MKRTLFFAITVLLSTTAHAFTCDLIEVDLNKKPTNTTKAIPAPGTVRGDMYPDVQVTTYQTKNGSMHINVASATRNYLYAEGFGQVNAGVTAFIERDDDSKQAMVLCNDFTRRSVPVTPVVP